MKILLNNLTENKYCSPIKRIPFKSEISQTFETNEKIKMPIFWNYIENLLVKKVQNSESKPFSGNLNISNTEKYLQILGVNARFKENQALADYVYKACIILKSKNIPLPQNILFFPPIIALAGIRGMTYCFQNHNVEQSPIFLPTNIAWLSGCLRTNEREKQPRSSSRSPYHTFFHETGHYLHFQNEPDIVQNCKIWSDFGDFEYIKNTVSKRAVATNDGSEFCAEYFAGTIAGKEYPDDISELYRKLKGYEYEHN